MIDGKGDLREKKKDLLLEYNFIIIAIRRKFAGCRSPTIGE
jgi:hypothetical protein